jgi:hypothetical protein
VFNVHGSVHRNNILIYIQQDATLHSLFLFYPETAVHVSGGTITHHQECKQLFLQHLVFVTPLLLSTAIMEEVEQFQIFHWQKESWQTFEETSGYVRPEWVNKWPNFMTYMMMMMMMMCNVASCWMYIRILTVRLLHFKTDII